jgi:hypothetical protein
VLHAVKTAAVNILVLSALLVAAEGAYRMLSPAGVFYRRTHRGGDEKHARTWARPHPRLGWVFSGTNLDTFRGSTRKWAASANEEGFRSPYDYRGRGAKAGVVRVMMLGDSFVFGPYLDDSDTLSARLQQRLGPGYQVDNFGMPGWGIDQMYLAYLEYVDVVEPDIVVAVYIDDDVMRVFEAFRGTTSMNKPSFDAVDGRLMLRDGDDSGLFDRLAAVSIIANRFYKHVYRPRVSDRIARALFRELARETRRRGQKLVVVRYPTKGEILRNWDDQVFDFKELFGSEQIVFLDPRDEMRAAAAAVGYRDFYLHDDAHPAREGNRFVARYIAENALSDQ